MSLEITDLHSGYYPGVNIINGVSLKTEVGKITALVGPNGCGKSTLFKTIFGFLKPESGDITFNRQSILGRKPHELNNLGLMLVPQTGGYFPTLTVYDNLRAFLWTQMKDKALMADSIERVFEYFPLLREKSEEKAGNMSGGMIKMLEACRVLLYDTQFVMFDEATAGLAPVIVKEIVSLVEDFRNKGLGIIMVDHNVRKLLEISDYVYNMTPTGQIASHGPTSYYREKPEELVKEWL
jgi:branched-chain amino acid transport system ATP-binding protein